MRKTCEARGNEARRVDAPRESKISAEILLAVFDGGKMSLARKDAVSELSKRAKTSIAAAYNALALDGRFRENLYEENGKLHWRQNSAVKSENKILTTTQN